METRESFLPETESLFDSYIQRAALTRRFLFTAAERAEYRQWLLHSKRPVTCQTAKERQQNHNNCNRAKNFFELTWLKLTIIGLKQKRTGGSANNDELSTRQPARIKASGAKSSNTRVRNTVAARRYDLRKNRTRSRRAQEGGSA